LGLAKILREIGAYSFFPGDVPFGILIRQKKERIVGMEAQTNWAQNQPPETSKNVMSPIRARPEMGISGRKVAKRMGIWGHNGFENVRRLDLVWMIMALEGDRLISRKYGRGN
jgi:hypothetical protein